MENMYKGLTVPKWLLIVWLKIPQMLQNLSAQFVCPSPKVLDFNEKRLHWASIVRDLKNLNQGQNTLTHSFFSPPQELFICTVKKFLLIKSFIATKICNNSLLQAFLFVCLIGR